nr:RusA family crossover junction endodeoxyribonuclease [Staphylococcus intermedius]
MRTTAPDIDNLLKAAMDSIFKGLKVKDSRITMVSMAKFQEMDHPRTEIVLRGIE